MLQIIELIIGKQNIYSLKSFVVKRVKYLSTFYFTFDTGYIINVYVYIEIGYGTYVSAIVLLLSLLQARLGFPLERSSHCNGFVVVVLAFEFQLCA